MDQREIDSNLSQWASEFPNSRGCIYRNKHLFGAEPPPNMGGVSDDEWAKVKNLYRESETSTGSK